jgi:hypothetical protein
LALTRLPRRASRSSETSWFNVTSGSAMEVIDGMSAPGISVAAPAITE